MPGDVKSDKNDFWIKPHPSPGGRGRDVMIIIIELQDIVQHRGQQLDGVQILSGDWCRGVWPAATGNDTTLFLSQSHSTGHSRNLPLTPVTHLNGILLLISQAAANGDQHRWKVTAGSWYITSRREITSQGENTLHRREGGVANITALSCLSVAQVIIRAGWVTSVIHTKTTLS